MEGLQRAGRQRESQRGLLSGRDGGKALGGNVCGHGCCPLCRQSRGRRGREGSGASAVPAGFAKGSGDGSPAGHDTGRG